MSICLSAREPFSTSILLSDLVTIIVEPSISTPAPRRCPEHDDLEIVDDVVEPMLDACRYQCDRAGTYWRVIPRDSEMRPTRDNAVDLVLGVRLLIVSGTCGPERDSQSQRAGDGSKEFPEVDAMCVEACDQDSISNRSDIAGYLAEASDHRYRLAVRQP
jgi:hypothetical protein